MVIESETKNRLLRQRYQEKEAAIKEAYRRKILSLKEEIAALKTRRTEELRTLWREYDKESLWHE